VLTDPAAPDSAQREHVTRVVFCSGKLYYDLSAADRPQHVAVVRVEQLYPWPHDGVAWALDYYPSLDEVVWAQEEPKNMGAWTFVAPRLRAAVGNSIPVTYIGRPERASPAEGYQASHQREQSRIVAEVLGRATAKAGSTAAPKGQTGSTDGRDAKGEASGSSAPVVSTTGTKSS
jgi:2-oxoglutarate dehydrogenase E1 component